MGSCMVEKFKFYIDLNEEEIELLLSLEETKENYRAGQIIAKQGDEIEKIYIVSKGWAYISTQLDQNIRSIFDVKMNGDFSGISEVSFDKHLYNFIALTDMVVCPFPKEHLDKLFQSKPKLGHAFYAVLSREQAILYERIASLGRRTALEKIAHFIIELSVRKNIIGNSVKNEFSFPITQESIADLLGMSTIHVNRSMNELKRHNYIRYDRTKIRILDYDRLLNLANFNRNFLQQPRRIFEEYAS